MRQRVEELCQVTLFMASEEANLVASRWISGSLLRMEPGEFLEWMLRNQAAFLGSWWLDKVLSGIAWSLIGLPASLCGALTDRMPLDPEHALNMTRAWTIEDVKGLKRPGGGPSCGQN